MRGIGVVTHGRAYAAHFVSCYTRSNPTAADEDAAFCLSFAYRQAYRLGRVGIIHGFSAARAQIQRLMAKLLEEGPDLLLELKACVIRSYGYFHN
jgi:hypothetical protein